jgi:integrase
VPIGADLVSRLRRYRMASGRPDDCRLVFPLGEETAWLRVREAADVGEPLPRFHDLRHTAATFFLAAGLRSHAVAELLGHADAGLVDRVYGHALPDEIAGAGAALERWLATAFATNGAVG